MDREPKIDAQNSRSNLFAFRRLKWGAPPERFRMDRVLRGSAGDAAHTNAEPGEVTDLGRRRAREKAVDVTISVFAATAVLWLTWVLLN
ncbi:hypothetical protein [Devosia sp. A369]